MQNFKFKAYLGCEFKGQPEYLCETWSQINSEKNCVYISMVENAYIACTCTRTRIQPTITQNK